MKIQIEKSGYTVKPFLIKQCGNTSNIGFRVYKDDKLVGEFQELVKLGLWFAEQVIEGTVGEEIEK